MATSAVNAAIDTVKSAVGAVTGAPTADEPVQATTDETSVSATDAKQKLERKLSLRPERDELVERNILKNTSVAPSLQAAQEELKRAQLEDSLQSKLQARPRPEELVKEGILNADEVPGA